MYHHPSCEECREGRRSIDVNHTSQLESFICSGFRIPVPVPVPVPDSGFPGFPYARLKHRNMFQKLKSVVVFLKIFTKT